MSGVLVTTFTVKKKITSKEAEANMTWNKQITAGNKNFFTTFNLPSSVKEDWERKKSVKPNCIE